MSYICKYLSASYIYPDKRRWASKDFPGRIFSDRCDRLLLLSLRAAMSLELASQLALNY